MRWLVAVLVVAFSALGNVAVAEEVSPVSAFTAGVKPVGQRTYAWGRTTPGVVVATQVQLEDGRWSTSQKSTASTSGAYKIPLTYGWNRLGSYRWRVVANVGGAWVVSEPFTLTRTNFRVGTAGVKPVGQTTFAWGVTAPNATVSAQVRLPNNRWSTSQTRTADGAGRFTVPMTYGQFELGRQQWRIVTNYRGAFVVSESFTLTRVQQGATVPKDCSVVVEGSRVSLAASQRSVTVVRTSGTRATVTMVAEDASMPQVDLLRYALSQYRSYAQAADKTASSIIVTTAVRLAPLHIPALRRLVEHDTLGLDRVGFEKTALFMVISDSDRQFSWLAALVFSMFFQRGIHLADQQEGRRLPVPVQCWMDEFANIGRIPDFDVLAATLRSRGISFAGVIQNVGQGKQLYRDGWNAILGNCDTVLFLGSADAETREYVSKALGRQTIVTTDSSSSRGRNSSTSRNRKTLGRELLSPDEVGRLPGNEAIVLVRGLPPFRDDKLAPVAESVPYTHQPGWNTRSWQ